MKSHVWLCFISESVFSIKLYFVGPSEFLSFHQLAFCGVFVSELSIHIHMQTLVFYLSCPRMHCASGLFKSKMNVLRGKTLQSHWYRCIILTLLCDSFIWNIMPLVINAIQLDFINILIIFIYKNIYFFYYYFIYKYKISNWHFIG